MKNTSDAKEQKKRGPLKRDYVHSHILLPPDLLEWAKRKEGGLGALVRQLLAHQREREQDTAAR